MPYVCQKCGENLEKFADECPKCGGLVEEQELEIDWMGDEEEKNDEE